MSAIPDELIEQVRDAADLVQLIGEHVSLKRTGSDYRGPCPFHGGTHRNLAVIPRKHMFYCFVCHAAGDVFSFYMKKLGMDYPGAVREVARRVGIEIPDRPAGGPDRREPLYSAVGVAAEWYAARLRDGADAAEARSYLAGRGIALESVGPLGLGFAPKGNAFLDAMRVLGLQEPVLFEAGLLVKRDDGSLRPRFWGRLLFPIHDLRGRIVGFGGRVIGEGEPKYLNSPESEVFHKGRLLYNLHHAKHAIRKAERAIVVEGYFDVLRLVETGLEHVVAPLGTGLTGDQAELLKRFTQNVVLLYDSDAAGLRATFRTADELLRAGLRVTVATLPAGEDPDTLAARGGRPAVDAILHDAIDVCERKLQLLDRKGWLGSLDGRRKALDRLVPTLRAASDPVTRDLYVSRVAEALGVTPGSVIREMSNGSPPAPVARRERAPAVTPSAPAGPPAARGPERELVRVMVHDPEWRSRIAPLLPDPAVLYQPEGALIVLLAATPADVPAAQLLERVDGAARMVLAQLLEEPWGRLDVDAIVHGALNLLNGRTLEAELRELKRRLPLAPENEKPALTVQVNLLSRRLSELKPGRWPVINQGGRFGS